MKKIIRIVMCMAMLCSMKSYAQNDKYEYECFLDYAGLFHEGMCSIQIEGSWGFIDDTGRECVPAEYDEVNDFHELMASVSKNGRWGFIMPDGYVKVPLQYVEVNDYSEGYAAVFNGDRWGYINEDGALRIGYEFDKAGYFKNGVAEVSKNGNSYYIDKKGNKVAAPAKKTETTTDTDVDEDLPYEKMFSEGFARVMRNNKFCIIDKKGNPLKLKLSPESAFNAGMVIEGLGDAKGSTTQEAYRAYAKALEYYKQGAEEGEFRSCFKVGYFYYGGYGVEKNYVKAVEYLKQSIDNEPNRQESNGINRLYLGMCYYIGGNGIDADMNMAIKYLRDGGENFYNASCYNQLAYCYAKQRLFNKAMDAIDNAIRIEPNNANYYDSKGEILLMQNRVDEATEMWFKVVEISPDFLRDYPGGTNLYNGLVAKGKIRD